MFTKFAQYFTWYR